MTTETKPKKSNRRIPILVVAGAIILLCGCCAIYAIFSPSKPASQAAAASPLSSDSPAKSPTPSLTSTPVQSSTPSITASPTETSTPVPPEMLTAQAAAVTQTAVSANATATRQAAAVTKTAFAANATATRQAAFAARTATAESLAATATLKAEYQTIPRQELISYADNHSGEKVKITIRVFNIISDTQLQGYFAGTYDAVIVEMSEPFSGIYENNTITVYGTVLGEHCGTNAFGGQVCQPAIIDAVYEKP